MGCANDTSNEASSIHSIGGSEAADAGIVNEDVDTSLQTKDLRDRVLDLSDDAIVGLEQDDVATRHEGFARRAIRCGCR